MPGIELSQVGDSSVLKMKSSNLQGEAKWKDIEDLINRWARKRPQRAIEHERYLREVRGNFVGNKWGFIDQFNDAGKQKKTVDGGTRISVSIPDELMQYIEAFYPKFLETKDELQEFKKRFPKFCILQKDLK